MMLEIRGLTKHFGGIRAVDGVDLLLGEGDLVGLIGPNGSGKTTVFNLVTGIYRPDSGSIALEGENLVGIPPHRINRLGIARTFQNIRLFRKLTVMDNVRIAHHSHLEYGPLAALCRTRRYYTGEKELYEKVEKFPIHLLASKQEIRDGREPVLRGPKETGDCKGSRIGTQSSPAR